MDRYDELLRTDVFGMPVHKTSVAHIHLTADQACVADADGILKDATLDAEETTEVTEFLNPMPYPRNLTVVASAATGENAKVIVYGTNIADQAISEEFTLAGDTPVVGIKAFKAITKIVLPVAAGSETINVGWGDKIGLPFMMEDKTLVFALQAGALETTPPTLAADADEIEKNTIDLNSALHSEKAVDIFLFL
jgi:hypothetical protein